MRAVVFERFGASDVLEWREIEDPALGDGEVLVRVHAAGLNYADVYRRQGNYHMDATPPWILGYEGAGEVIETHGACDGFKVGDRVAFADCPRANAELVAVPAGKLIRLADEVSYETAAAVLLQGLTAQYLTRDSYKVRKGDIALVHAAAGGVGLLLTQMLVHAGAIVVGLASSDRKAEAARRNGAKVVLSYQDDWAAKIWAEFGRGADVVYESTGATLLKSMEILRIGGSLVFYGFAGGEPPSIEPRMLMDKSITVTGGDLWNVLTGPQERRARAAELLALCSEGVVRPVVAETVPMSAAGKAHEMLEGRGTIGKILLVPDSIHA